MLGSWPEKSFAVKTRKIVSSSARLASSLRSNGT
jgi:hypothetical protein